MNFQSISYLTSFTLSLCKSKVEKVEGNYKF